MNLTVVKIGGRALEAPDAAAQLAAAATRIPGRVVFVHGGGAEVTGWCGRLGIATRAVDGLRVTDGETLPVATAVLAGLANKRLVARFRAAGIDAVGISGVDGGILEIEPHPDHERLGSVGVVKRAHVGLLKALIAAGWTPVIASIGALDGALYNLNADEAARALAAELQVDDLVLLSDVKALMIDGAPVKRAAGVEIDALLEHAQITDGMRAKVRAVHAALKGGVRRVFIGAWNGPETLARILEGRGEGTVFVRETSAVEDVSHV